MNVSIRKEGRIMRIIVSENYDEMSKIAAKMVASQLLLKPNSVIGLPTGATPIGMYAELVKMYNAGETDFSQTVTFNLDEYYPIDRENPQSYYYFMNVNLYSKVNLKPQNIHIPHILNGNVETECENYDKLIEENGGIDLQVLGIGSNGHIGFNEPAGELNDRTHLTKLTEETIADNSRFFTSEDQVPRYAITVGMATILMAKKIILLVSGKSKSEPLKRLLTGKISTAIPATMLNLHRDTVIIIDKNTIGDEYNR
jgi:glucosamine-6-phosphate deaminase